MLPIPQNIHSWIQQQVCIMKLHYQEETEFQMCDREKKRRSGVQITKNNAFNKNLDQQRTRYQSDYRGVMYMHTSRLEKSQSIS
jgi:hypothetical protein